METGDTMALKRGRKVFTDEQKRSLIAQARKIATERGISLRVACDSLGFSKSSFEVWSKQFANPGPEDEEDDGGPSEATIAARHSAIHWQREAERWQADAEATEKEIESRDREIVRLRDTIVKLSILLLEAREIA